MASRLLDLLEKQPLSILVVLPILFSVLRWAGGRKLKNRFPILNPKKPFELTIKCRVGDFIDRSKEILLEGRAKFKTTPYRLLCDLGEVIVLPHNLIDEIKSQAHLDFGRTVSDDSHSYIPGFEPFVSDPGLPRLINRYLTKTLTKLTGPLSEEATHSLKRILTDSEDWHLIDPKVDIMKYVSQLSSRVFMGQDLCRDDDWLKASTDYTTLAFSIGDSLRAWPRSVRPFIHWFMPQCWELRRKLNDARRVLAPHIERRNNMKKKAAEKGETLVFDDSIDWYEKEGKGNQDAAMNQITLSLTAIHTTTDLLIKTMFDLTQHPELLKPLRKEIVDVFTADGLKKTSLYNLKLMDSVVKETQRMHPVVMGILRRGVTADIKLSNGVKLYKGEKITADTTHMWDSSHYPAADQYDGYRFLRMREDPQQGKHAHLVSTSADHLGFGHGQHACPGRFFAANEAKIALAHLLLKYEWKVAGDLTPECKTLGMTLLPDQDAKLLIRRRREEIDLDALETE